MKWLINSLPVNKLVLKPTPEKWSIHDIVAHLAKYQPGFIDRIIRMLNEDGPLLKRYKAEEDPDFEEWRSWSTETLINFEPWKE